MAQTPTQRFARPAHPNRLGDISVLYAGVMGRTLSDRGIDPEALFAPYRITPELLATPGARITIPRFMRLGHSAIALTGDPAIGLAFGAQTRLTDMGVAGLAACCAPTLGESLTTLIRFERLTSYNSRGRSSFRWHNNGDLEARFYSISPYNRFNCFVVDSILAGWTAFIGDLGGFHDRSRLLRQVTIEYPRPGHAEVMEHWFSCPVRFDGEDNALVLNRTIARQPNPLAEPATFQELVNQCERQQASIESGWSVVERVRDVLTPRLRGQPATMETVAAQLGTTAWGLRRQLAEKELTYRELVDRIRSELALDYVRETGLSFAEIGYLLGFANPTGFHRAFLRWTGKNPGDYRRETQA